MDKAKRALEPPHLLAMSTRPRKATLDFES